MSNNNLTLKQKSILLALRGGEFEQEYGRRYYNGRYCAMGVIGQCLTGNPYSILINMGGSHIDSKLYSDILYWNDIVQLDFNKIADLIEEYWTNDKQQAEGGAGRA